MTKWYGMIGYADSVETEPGIWEPTITERPYFGDIIQNIRMLQNSSGINDNVNINNQISVVSDPYAVQHIHDMQYVEYQGAKWKVSNVTVQHPRLLLNIGGLWNGDENRITK